MKGISNDVPWRGQGDVIRNRVTGNGKGDKARPLSVDDDSFAANWERTFGKRDKQAE